MNPRAGLMVDGEVAPVRVSSKQIKLLFIYDQFLQEKKKELCEYLTESTSKLGHHDASVPLSYNSSALLPLKGLNLMANVALAPFEAEQPRRNPTSGTQQTVRLVSGAHFDIKTIAPYLK